MQDVVEIDPEDGTVVQAPPTSAAATKEEEVVEQVAKTPKNANTRKKSVAKSQLSPGFINDCR